MNITRELVKFDWFEHNLIINFQFIDNKFIFESYLVDFDVPIGTIEFIQYMFHNVTDFNRFIPQHPHGNRFEKTVNKFQAKDFTGDYEAESSNVYRKENDLMYIKIVLPYLLGTIDFSFTHCEAVKRVAIQEKNQEGVFVNKDIITGNSFDFDAPFQ